MRVTPEASSASPPLAGEEPSVSARITEPKAVQASVLGRQAAEIADVDAPVPDEIAASHSLGRDEDGLLAAQGRRGRAVDPDVHELARLRALPAKFTVVFRRVRPRRTAGSVRLGPSTSTSSTPPTRSAFRSAASAGRPRSAARSARASPPRGPGRPSRPPRCRPAARRRTCTRRRSRPPRRPRRVSRKSASVSPGKPTMMSVVSARSGIAARSSSTSVEVALARVRAAHRLEDPRRAGLERQVRVLADRGALGHRGDHVGARSPSGAGS